MVPLPLAGVNSPARPPCVAPRLRPGGYRASAAAGCERPWPIVNHLTDGGVGTVFTCGFRRRDSLQLVTASTSARPDVQVAESRDPRRHLPILGFRDFWYPAALSHQVRAKPEVVRLLGDEIVLLRTGGKLLALRNLCPHRGTRLSLGKSHFAGTISCAYHGWTFNDEGVCVAALAEGPSSPIVGKARVRAYPVREKWGVVWLYMGEQPSPALEEDLFAELLEDERDWTTFIFANEWDCGWRESLDNPLDSSHAQYIHRRALYWLGRPIPGWVNLGVTPISHARTLKVFTKRQGMQAEYPGLGKYPRHIWWRRIGDAYNAPKAVSDEESAGASFEVRMPCVVRIPDFLDRHTMWIRWIVPIDETHSRNFFFYMRRGRGLEGVLFRVKNWFLWSWAIRLGFSKQDEWIIEAQIAGSPERLSGNDVALIAWRRWAPKWAAERASSAANAGTPPLPTTVGSQP